MGNSKSCVRKHRDYHTISWDHLDVDELIKRMVQMVKWSLWKYGFQKGYIKDWDLQLPWLIMRYKFN